MLKVPTKSSYIDLWKILTWYDNYQLSKGIIITLEDEEAKINC